MLQRAMIGILLLGAGATPAPLHDAFSAAAAYSYTAKVAGFGERWPGSLGHQKTQDLVRQVLTKNGARIETDDFTATTPRGPIAVHNIIGKFNVTADPKQSIFILAGHYDTLFKPGFIGANDGASSTGILLAFADALKDQKTKMQIWLVWTDLEEALESFVGDDGLYGSRHLAQKLAANGTAPRIKGFFLLDMIGDKDLGVARETTSKAWLQDYIAQAAKQLGYSQYFFQYRGQHHRRPRAVPARGRAGRGCRGRAVRPHGAQPRRHGRVPPRQHRHDGQGVAAEPRNRRQNDPESGGITGHAVSRQSAVGSRQSAVGSRKSAVGP